MTEQLGKPALNAGDSGALGGKPNWQVILDKMTLQKAANAKRDPTDEAILAAVGRWGNRAMTYVVRNILWSAGFRRETPWIRRQLMRLEREGKVVRVSSGYATQICWSVAKEPTP